MKMSLPYAKSFQNAVSEKPLSVRGCFSYSNSWSICYPKHVGTSSAKLLCIMWKTYSFSLKLVFGSSVHSP